MKQRSVPAWLLAASLALNAGVVVAIALHQWQGVATPASPRPASVNLPDYLALNAEQRARWQQLEPAFLRDVAANWSDIRRHREALVRHIFSDAPQRAAIDAEQARIATLQDAQQQRVIAQLLAERALLDEGQRARLKALLLSRYAQESTEEEALHRD